jgi:hypothetical protein
MLGETQQGREQVISWSGGIFELGVEYPHMPIDAAAGQQTTCLI